MTAKDDPQWLLAMVLRMYLAHTSDNWSSIHRDLKAADIIGNSEKNRKKASKQKMNSLDFDLTPTQITEILE